MSERLAHWLDQHEAAIMPRWVRRVRERGVTNEQLKTTELRAAFFVNAYAGLIEAARGDYSRLTDALHAAASLRGRTDRTLPLLLEIPFQLRRIVWDVAIEQDDAAATLHILAELEPLTEWMVGALSRQFGHEVEQALRQRIDEAEYMATKLAVATEEADNAALRINRLYTFTQALNGNLHLRQLVTIIGTELQHALGTDRCAIWLRADDTLYNALAWGYPQPLDTIHYGIDDTTLVPLAFQRSKPWLLPDPSAQNDGGWVDPEAALMALPLVVGDTRLGVIVVQGARGTLATDHIELAQSFATQAALALENARLYDQIVRFNAELEQRIEARTQELRAERDRLDLLFAISSAVSSTLDIDTMLNDLLDVLAKRMNVRHGSVMLLDDEASQLVRRATLGSALNDLTHFPLGLGVAGWVAQHREPLLIDDVTVEPRWIAPVAGSGEHKQTGALLAVPLLASDELLGVLTLSHPEIGYFTIDHQRMLTVVANTVAVAIRNADLYGYISDQATRLASMVRSERENASQSQAILQSIADGVLVGDRDGQIILANPMSAQILDQPLEDLFMANLHEVLQPLKMSGHERTPLRDVLEAPLDEHDQPRRFRATARLGPRSIDMAVAPVLSDRDEPLGVVAILRDISREIESDRLKTEFIGTVSHELRTPMTVIKGYLQLMATGSIGELTPTQRQMLDTIRANAERMTAIINDLLDITKIESGSVDLEFRPVDVLQTISQIVGAHQTLLTDRRHQLTIDMPPDLPTVLADSDRLRQVLDNLFSNALKYTPKGGHITITAQAVGGAEILASHRAGLSTRRRYVTIDVADTGIGLASEDLERIFERFYRVESDLKVEAGGTGLGLAIVRPLIELMGGRVWVESEPGKGATFTVAVPIARHDR